MSFHMFLPFFKTLTAATKDQGLICCIQKQKITSQTFLCIAIDQIEHCVCSVKSGLSAHTHAKALLANQSPWFHICLHQSS